MSFWTLNLERLSHGLSETKTSQVCKTTLTSLYKTLRLVFVFLSVCHSDQMSEAEPNQIWLFYAFSSLCIVCRPKYPNNVWLTQPIQLGPRKGPQTSVTMRALVQKCYNRRWGREWPFRCFNWYNYWNVCVIRLLCHSDDFVYVNTCQSYWNNRGTGCYLFLPGNILHDIW